MTSIAAKIGCTLPTLHDWVKKAEIDSAQRVGVPTDMADKLTALVGENRELRQANEILRKASAYFATAELAAGPCSADYRDVIETLKTKREKAATAVR